VGQTALQLFHPPDPSPPPPTFIQCWAVTRVDGQAGNVEGEGGECAQPAAFFSNPQLFRPPPPPPRVLSPKGPGSNSVGPLLKAPEVVFMEWMSPARGTLDSSGRVPPFLPESFLRSVSVSALNLIHHSKLISSFCRCWVCLFCSATFSPNYSVGSPLPPTSCAGLVAHKVHCRCHFPSVMPGAGPRRHLHGGPLDPGADRDGGRPPLPQPPGQALRPGPTILLSISRM